jgi:hypothetical protein
MKILYIAPYRLSNSIGYESINLLCNLYDMGLDVVSRPVFDGTKTIKDKKFTDILEITENKQINSFDVIIQNVSILNYCYTSKIPYHIFWPITHNIMPSYEQKQKYAILDEKINYLYSNNTTKFILDNIDIKNKKELTYTINHRFYSQNNIGKYNLGIYSKYKKYYTIIDNLPEYIVKDVIINFIKTFEDNSNTCLILYICNISQQTLETYNKYIKDMYNLFEINYSITNIVIVPIDNTISNVITAHNTGDIFLSLSDNIQTPFANKLNRPIINISVNNHIWWNQLDLNKNGSVSSLNDSNIKDIAYTNIIPKDNIQEILETHAQ